MSKMRRALAGFAFAAMLALYAAKAIRPVVDRVFPLAEASAAHQHMEAASQFGKIVLKIAN